MTNRFMARAIELATENAKSGTGGPFGAVIVRSDEIVAEGTNRVTSASDPSAHAEIVAIREACKKLARFELRDCEMYASCEPCPMCLGAIYWARLARVYFGAHSADAAGAGFDDSMIYAELRRGNSERRIPMVSMMREEALEAFRAWAANPGKLPY